MVDLTNREVHREVHEHVVDLRDEIEYQKRFVALEVVYSVECTSKELDDADCSAMELWLALHDRFDSYIYYRELYKEAYMYVEKGRVFVSRYGEKEYWEDYHKNEEL